MIQRPLDLRRMMPRGGLRAGGADRFNYEAAVKAIKPANLVAYWPLSETSGTQAADVSGNNRHGTYVGGPTLAQAGIGDAVDKAPLFSGSGQYVNIYSAAFASAFNPSEGTISLWVKGGAVWSDNANRLLLELRADSNNYIHLFKSGTNDLSWERMAGGVSSAMGTSFAAADMDQLKPPSADWHHLVLSWSTSADRVRASFDGSQVGYEVTGLGTWSGALASTMTVIGALSTALFFWAGQIAHVAVWDTELTAAEIYTLAWQYAKPSALFFGDSITNGIGASDDAHKWVRIVKAALGLRYGNNQGVSATLLQNTVQNSIAVIGGASSNNGEDTYATRVIRYNCNGPIFIAYGLNDLRLNDPAITQAAFLTGLGKIIDAIVASGAPASRIVLCSPPHISKIGAADTAPWQGGSVAKMQAYTAAIAAMANSKGTKFADFYNRMLTHGGDALVGPDGIHPNDSGHAELAAEALAAVL